MNFFGFSLLVGGWAALDVKPQGRKRGEGRQLTIERQRTIRQMICDKTPDPLKLWNRQAVARLVRIRLGLELPIRTAAEYLRRWGFTPQKPVK